jgi:soluble lytic murein transglycosylase-like protein
VSTTNKYDIIIRKWAGHYGIPFHLVKAVIRWESSFREDAVSRCGAKGLMQLMPSVYRPAEINPLDPMENVMIGCRYLKRLWLVFAKEDGWERWKFALASYNAGMKYVINAQKRARAAGAKDYKWYHISIFMKGAWYNLRKCDWKQTTEYVDRIMERMWGYQIEHAGKRLEKCQRCTTK